MLGIRCPYRHALPRFTSSKTFHGDVRSSRASGFVLRLGAGVPREGNLDLTEFSAPTSHHLDRRAHTIAERIAHLPADALLAPAEAAEWLGVCKEWLSIGRCRGYGPAFLKLAPGLIRYRVSDIRRFLDERSTSERANTPAAGG